MSGYKMSGYKMSGYEMSGYEMSGYEMSLYEMSGYFYFIYLFFFVGGRLHCPRESCRLMVILVGILPRLKLHKGGEALLCGTSTEVREGRERGEGEKRHTKPPYS